MTTDQNIDLARIKRNVAKMAAQNAPTSDIDGYIASEGATIEQIRDFKSLEQADVRGPQGQKAELGVNAQGDVDYMYKEQPDAPSGLAQGLLDPVAGAGQFVPRVLEQVTSLGGLTPNRVSELYGKSAERADQYARQREEKYQAGRQAAGKDGIDVGRIIGNVANPVNYMGGTGWGATLARGLGFGAMQPVSDTDNYAMTKGVQIGAGGAGAALGKGVSDTIVPKVSGETAKIAQLLKEKVPLTPGQRSQGLVRSIENKATSVPILGDVIKGAQKRSIEGMNKAAYNRALDPIGKTLPKDVNVGREAVDYTIDQLSQSYDDLLPKLTGQVDDQFIDDLGKLREMVDIDDIMNAGEKKKFTDILQNSVMSRISKGKGITGEALKEIESELGEKAAKFGKGSIQEKQLSDVLAETQKALRQMLERSNPQYAKELAGINKGYANLLRIQRAAGSTGAEEGVFTPAQLQSAVRGLDPSKNKRQFARGEALMQDLSEAGKSVLPNNIPNSGTVDRAAIFGLGAPLLSTGTYGAGEFTDNPYLKAAGIALAPSLLYTRGGTAAANKLANALSSPVMQPIGQTLPYVAGPTAAQIYGK